MAGEIASAYVRIRPSMAGFREETIAGVKGAMTGVTEQARASDTAQIEGNNEVIASNARVSESVHGIGRAEQETRAETERLKAGMMGIGKVIGITFGVEAIVKFTESLVEGAKGAAQMQKSIEVIHSTFGKAGKALIDFADKGATALGISGAEANATSAKFGILFKNMNIGPQVAATMSENLEKLAGSLSAIRGVDPSKALSSITLAMLGNVRSLKQLGVAVDPAAIKIAAFRLGLIKQGEALTPAARAQAIYAIATAHLGDYMDQAKAHAGDLANVQRRLSAEWSNAKDKLGSSLLPVMTKLALFMSRILPGAVTGLSRVFGDLSKVVQGVAKFLAPAFEPVVKEIEKMHAAFSKGGISGLKKMFDGMSPAAKGAAVAIGVVTAALVALAFSVAPITLTIVAIGALGVALDEAYKHSARFRAIVDEVKSAITDRLVPAFQHIAARAAPLFAQLWKSVSKVFNDIIVIIGQVAKVGQWVWEHFGSAITSITNRHFNAVIKIVGDAFQIIAGAFDTIKDILTGKWGAAWDDIKGILSNAFDIMKTEVVTWGQDIGDVFKSVWTNLERIALVGVSKVLEILAKIPTSFHIFGHKVGFDNPAKAALEDVKGLIKGIDDQAAAKSLAAAVASNTAKALDAKTRDPAIADAATKLGKHIHEKVKVETLKGVATGAVPAVTSAVSNGFAEAQTQIDQAAKDGRDQIAQLKQKLHDMIVQNAIDIRNSVRDAKANLLSISGSLASQIGQVIDQPFVVAGQKLQDAQDKLALIFDKKNVALDAQSRKLAAMSARIGLQNDKLALAGLRGEVSLPGGKLLSQDPEKATRQLQALLKSANNMNRPAIEAFINEYKSALLQVSGDKLGIKKSKLDDQRAAAETPLMLKRDAIAVAQDTANRLKTITTRSLADLATALTTHAITLRQFNKKLATLLERDHVSYKKAGALLGSAFTDGFRANAQGLVKQAKALKAGPDFAGTGQEPKITFPEQVLKKGLENVANLRDEITHKKLDLANRLQREQLSLDRRIAKAAERTAKAAEKTAAANKASKAVVLGPTSKDVDHNPGHSSKKARELAGT